MCTNNIEQSANTSKLASIKMVDNQKQLSNGSQDLTRNNLLEQEKMQELSFWANFVPV